MLGRSHAISGALAWVALIPVLPYPAVQVVAGAGVAAMGALLPDLDTEQSKAARVLGPLRRPVCLTIRRVAGGHRAGTHYLLTALTVGALLYWWTPWIGAAVAVGMMAHSLGDMCTVQGVTWLWPLPARFRGPVHTGSKVETHLIAPAFTLALMYLVYLHTHTTITTHVTNITFTLTP